MRARLASSVILFWAGFSLQAQNLHWIGSWGASPSPQIANAAEMLSDHYLFANETVREVVRVSAPGNSLRVRLSNAYSRESATIGSVHIALRDRESSIVAGSDRAVEFGEKAPVTIPPDAEVLSDTVSLDVPALSEVVISIYLPKAVAGAGLHYSAQQTTYIGPGDQTASSSFQKTAEIRSWVFLNGLDVSADADGASVVAFGDSITDGALSTIGANRRWPDVLADRLEARKSGPKLGVLNEGIGGNRILHDPASNAGFGNNGLARFDRDVLAQSGVRYVIVLEGINDIGQPMQSAPAAQQVSAEDVIFGLKQMIERAHEKGLKIYGGTLTPFEGTAFPGYFTPEKEREREAVNDWIRTSHAFDGVIDFDKAVRDPQHPNRMLPAYDSGDHLHPGDAGYKAMGEAIDLALFE